MGEKRLISMENQKGTLKKIPKNRNARRPAAGPLVVTEANPRYFTVGAGNAAGREAIYLTGSHIWNNFHDGLGPGTSCVETPEQNDYGAYLDFLKLHEAVQALTEALPKRGLTTKKEVRNTQARCL